MSFSAADRESCHRKATAAEGVNERVMYRKRGDNE